MAAKAYDTLNATLAEGAGQEIANMVTGITASNEHDLLVANIGQLKYVSAPFFDRLAEVGFVPGSIGWPVNLVLDSGQSDNAPEYPWLDGISPNNTSPASLGQLKHVFSWDAGQDNDNNGAGDGLLDWWEQLIADQDTTDAIYTFEDVLAKKPADVTGLDSKRWDFDDDGFANIEEFKAKLDPFDKFNGLGPNAVVTPPTAPDGLTVKYKEEQDTLEVTWQNTSGSTSSSSDASAFRVERSVNGGDFEVVDTVSSSTTMWTDSTIGSVLGPTSASLSDFFASPGNNVVYQVSAQNNSTASSPVDSMAGNVSSSEALTGADVLNA